MSSINQKYTTYVLFCSTTSIHSYIAHSVLREKSENIKIKLILEASKYIRYVGLISCIGNRAI